MATLRKAISEDMYRRRLRLQIKPTLERTTKAAIARRWGRPKSAVTRLESEDIPTTLGNLDSLAAALDMELGELLWPLVNPKDPEGAAQEAEESYNNAEVEVFNRHVRQLKDDMASDDAQRLVRVVAGLARVAPDELRTVIDIVEGLTLLRKGESK